MPAAPGGRGLDAGKAGSLTEGLAKAWTGQPPNALAGLAQLDRPASLVAAAQLTRAAYCPSCSAPPWSMIWKEGSTRANRLCLHRGSGREACDGVKALATLHLSHPWPRKPAPALEGGRGQTGVPALRRLLTAVRAGAAQALSVHTKGPHMHMPREKMSQEASYGWLRSTSGAWAGGGWVQGGGQGGAGTGRGVVPAWLTTRKVPW